MSVSSHHHFNSRFRKFSYEKSLILLVNFICNFHEIIKLAPSDYNLIFHISDHNRLFSCEIVGSECCKMHSIHLVMSECLGRCWWSCADGDSKIVNNTRHASQSGSYSVPFEQQQSGGSGMSVDIDLVLRLCRCVDRSENRPMASP